MEELFPYTPRKTKFEVLEATFVGRHALLDELKSTIRGQATADTLQHWMILGSRGTGKSHIITMIYHIVRNEPEYNSNWIPVLMNEEEQGVFSLPTLFIRIVTKLADELEKDNKEKAKEIRDYLSGMRSKITSPDAILEDAVTCLKSFSEDTGKRLLVLLENADDLFTKCMPNQNEVKKFRRMLQHENYFLLIATSPTFFERIRSRKGVLYDFFRLRRLDLLNYDDSVMLLQRWAEKENPSLVQEFKPGNYRLRVLYHLTGGNPRILMFLFMAISGQERIESAVSTFRILLEKDLSNYYLSRMRDIPNQEQPVVIALAETSGVLTQTEIASKTFLSPKNIGTFMVRLENAGLVRPVSQKKGKNTLYTLTDNLFRLWYQWRTSLREKEVVEAIVEFLSIWYKKEELRVWAGGQGIIAEHAQEALSFRDTERFKSHLELFQKETQSALDKYLATKDYRATFETINYLIEYGIDTSNIESSIIDFVKKCESHEDLECFSKALNESNVLNAGTFLKIGKVFLEKEEFLDAEKVLSRATILNPEDANAWGNLGLVRGKQENYVGAEEALTRAVTLDPEDADAWRMLGAARIKQENHNGAEEALTRAVALDPEDAKTWGMLGAARGRQKNHAGAEEALTRAVTLDPEDADAWRMLGAVRIKQENHNGAEEALTRAVTIDSEDANAWGMLGAAHIKQGNYAGAEEALTRVITLDPEDADAWGVFGAARIKQGNYARAEEALTRALTLNPEDANAWGNLGVARGRLKNYAEAEEALTRAVTFNPEDADAWRMLGAARGRQKNHSGAEEALTRAVTLDPEDADAWRMLGAARINQENHNGAEEALTRAVTLDPGDANAWGMLGSARGKQENYAGAEEALTKAVTLDPEDVILWKMLGVLNFKNYHFSECKTSILKGLELKKNIFDFIWFSMLGEVYLRTGLIPEVFEIIGKNIQNTDSRNEDRTLLLLYRAILFLHRGDRSLFKKDLQFAVELISALSDESKREVQGRLIDFVLDVTYDDNITDIKTYLITIQEYGPELAAILSPMDYLVGYFETYYSEAKDPKKGKKRAQDLLERIPSELRDSVETMINKIKGNIKWWNNRPEKEKSKRKVLAMPK